MTGLDLAFGYLDDISVFSLDIKIHLKHPIIMFQRLLEADLKLKESVCNFLKAHIQYLCLLISGKGIELLHEKLRTIKDKPSPSNQKESKQFLGLVVNYQ